MTTLKAFDEMMGQFLGEIAQTFPDEPPKTAVNCKTFLKQIAPWANQLTSRDDAFFCDDNEFVKGMNLVAIWNSPECSDATKQAIWQYLSSLYMMGTTFSMFPPETLSMIESAAENCAKQMKMNPNGQLDEAALMSGVNNMLSQMMSGGGGANNPFAALLGAQQPAPPKSNGSRKKKSSR